MLRKSLALAAVLCAAAGGTLATAHLGTSGHHNLAATGDWTVQAPPQNTAFAVTRGNGGFPSHPARTDGKRLRDELGLYFRLQQGWLYTDGTPRSEVYSVPQTPRVGQPYLPTYLNEGEVWCFGWSEYLPANFPTSAGGHHNILAQWQGRLGGTPALLLVHEGSLDQLKLKNNRTGHTYWSAPMSQFRGKWNDFLFSVDFDRNPALAGVQAWVNGAQVVNSLGQQYTMRPDQDGKSYPKVGLYTTDRPEVREAWVNGYRQSTSCELADPQSTHP
jgi:hypothetical protein